MTNAPVVGLHSFAAEPQGAVSTVVPSGEKTADSTGELESVTRHAPVVALQIAADDTGDAVSTVVPSDEKTADAENCDDSIGCKAS